MKVWTVCEGVEVVTISEIYYLGYFQVKYNINNIMISLNSFLLLKY